MSNYFQEVFNLHVSASAGVADATTEDIWNNIKNGLLKTTKVCGTTRPSHCHFETLWWNEHVEKAVAAKGKDFKAWKTGKGTRASYKAAKCISRHSLHHACQEANSRPCWLSWMRRPTGDQEVAGSTPAEVGNILSWRLIMKYFLRSFSPFR